MERFEFAARGDFRLAVPAAVFARYLTPPWKTVFASPDSLLTLRVRLAWAHDFDPDRSIAATFQALPGASFVVNGAAQSHDSALSTASAEIKWLNGWSAAATFEGEFSGVTRSYAGNGVVRYSWRVAASAIGRVGASRGLAR
jgi:Autotransporter beta-domain